METDLCRRKKKINKSNIIGKRRASTSIIVQTWLSYVCDKIVIPFLIISNFYGAKVPKGVRLLQVIVPTVEAKYLRDGYNWKGTLILYGCNIHKTQTWWDLWIRWRDILSAKFISDVTVVPRFKSKNEHRPISSHVLVKLLMVGIAHSAVCLHIKKRCQNLNL